jgi:dipeptidase E
MGGRPARPLLELVAGLGRRTPPRLLWVGTANNEDASAALAIHDLTRGLAEFSRLEFNPWPPPDLRGFVLAHDVVLVGGGNTANMLAVWRTHGFDAILREAWEAGIVLAGWSAGMICWFEAGVTDSFGPQLAGMDCLGLLPGSACPHYDGEELRRPAYRRLVGEGFPAGYAADDAAALHFAGTELAEVLTTREGAGAYRVDAEGEVALQARLLT